MDPATGTVHGRLVKAEVGVLCPGQYCWVASHRATSACPLPIILPFAFQFIRSVLGLQAATRQQTRKLLNGWCAFLWCIEGTNRHFMRVVIWG